ncbi:MAG: biotin--[acetyl-CoA-carboxylase] ligase [Solirubrobacteraceae bacterium]
MRGPPTVALTGVFGTPRRHLREVDSTNRLARELAAAGARHGALVSADAQFAGRGRQGRAWIAPPGNALIGSWVVREPRRLLSLAAGVAVAELCGPEAMVKWPNDVLLGGLKVAGILVQGRPQEGWAVLGIGINVAVEVSELPAELRDRAGTLGLSAGQREPLLARLNERLARWLAAPDAELLEALSARDTLRGRPVRWQLGGGDLAAHADQSGSGVAAGLDQAGRLLIRQAQGGMVALDAGEVHLI